MSVIIGIDPGLASTGYGVVESKGNSLVCLEYGTFLTESTKTLGERLESLFQQINQVLYQFKPDKAAIEGLFFSKNVTSALPVSHARGVLILALQQQGILITELSPNAIKKGVVGMGKADKHQVTQMVKIILGIQEFPETSHAADALAAAIACSTGVIT